MLAGFRSPPHPPTGGIGRPQCLSGGWASPHLLPDSRVSPHLLPSSLAIPHGFACGAVSPYFLPDSRISPYFLPGGFVPPHIPAGGLVRPQRLSGCRVSHKDQPSRMIFQQKPVPYTSPAYRRDRRERFQKFISKNLRLYQGLGRDRAVPYSLHELA